MITHTILIASPLERVFELIADFDKMRTWMTSLEETTILGPSSDPGAAPSGVGTRFRQRLREGGHCVEYEGEIVAFSPPQLLGLEMKSRQADLHMEFRCRAEGPESTRLELHAELRAKTLAARLAIPLYTGRAREQLVTHLERLKQIAESG